MGVAVVATLLCAWGDIWLNGSSGALGAERSDFRPDDERTSSGPGRRVACRVAPETRTYLGAHDAEPTSVVVVGGDSVPACDASPLSREADRGP
jgi:hypothetical protein